MSPIEVALAESQDLVAALRAEVAAVERRCFRLERQVDGLHRLVLEQVELIELLGGRPAGGGL